ncbi:MAG: hypothetical protein NVS3B12_09410 [Acidimicrobiales bacterium]
MRTVVLIVHVTAGTTGLVLGPLAMRAPKRRGRHTKLGVAYQWATGALCLSAIALAALKPALWWLGVIAVAIEVAALGGWAVQRRRRPGWVRLPVSLMCGSYVSFVTAFLVVNLGLGSWLAWVAPTMIGSPLIARAAARAASGNHPAMSSPRTPITGRS